MLKADKISVQLEVVELSLDQRIHCLKILCAYALRQTLLRKHCELLLRWANSFAGDKYD
jgi:hypothetical protein